MRSSYLSHNQPSSSTINLLTFMLLTSKTTLIAFAVFWILITSYHHITWHGWWWDGKFNLSHLPSTISSSTISSTISLEQQDSFSINQHNWDEIPIRDHDMLSCETDYEMVNEIMTQKQYHLTLMTRDGVYKTSIKNAGIRATRDQMRW